MTFKSTVVLFLNLCRLVFSLYELLFYLAILCIVQCVLLVNNDLSFTTLNEASMKSKLRPVHEDPEHYTGYDIIYNPEEWKYVERLFPVKWIPDPTKKESYPSGWKPQSADADKHPYLVERTKNHMLPVYLEISERGMRKITIIRRVEGDIWKLSEDLTNHLKLLMNYSTIGVRVEELKRAIFLRGDYFEYTKTFLSEKGF